MTPKPTRIMFLILLMALAGCSTVTVGDYGDKTPKLILENFFEGKLTAHGILKNRSGLVTRTFTATINASWQDGIGTLDELFTFDDGEEQTRVWTLTPTSKNIYTGTASDVIGKSTLQLAGNSLFLKYILRVSYNDDEIDLTIDDRMYLISDKVLINESIMTKWGFEVGQLTLVIRKLS